MYQISDEQIDFILNDISARGVKIEDLQQNILDHVCCIIEQNLEANGDFGQFYLRTINTFFKKELGEIEEETILLLTFKNYYKMKKAMMVSGTISVTAFIFGCIFKIMHWPGAGIILFLGIGIMSLIFLPILFILKSREMSQRRDKYVLALGTLCGILYSLGVLLLVMHWPGARIIWLSALALSFFVFVPVYFFTGIRKPETKMNTIVSSMLIVAIVGLQITLTALRPNPNTQSKTYLYAQNEQMLDLMHKEYGNELAEEIQVTCEQVKAMILQAEIGESTMPADFEERNMVMYESNDVRSSILNTPKGAGLIAKLRMDVERYNGLYPGSKVPMKYSILDPQFAERKFCNNLFVINNITQLQIFMAYSGQAKAVASVE